MTLGVRFQNFRTRGGRETRLPFETRNLPARKLLFGAKTWLRRRSLPLSGRKSGVGPPKSSFSIKRRNPLRRDRSFRAEWLSGYRRHGSFRRSSTCATRGTAFLREIEVLPVAGLPERPEKRSRQPWLGRLSGLSGFSVADWTITPPPGFGPPAKVYVGEKSRLGRRGDRGFGQTWLLAGGRSSIPDGTRLSGVAAAGLDAEFRSCH